MPEPLPGGADPGAVAEALSALSGGSRSVVPGGPLGPLTTYRVGGPAAVLVTAVARSDLVAIAEAAGRSGLPILVVGRGSNLLVSDAGFGGIAVLLDQSAFGSVHIEGTTVTAGAAASLPALARRTVDAGLAGLEWAVGVPGSVGGAVVMNAGGHGSDTAHWLRSCLVADLAAKAAPVSERDLAWLSYGYRRSAIRPEHAVVEASFRLRTGDVDDGRAAIREIVSWRREHQPGGQNAGSVFTNPPHDSAGRLIETAGLKGLRFNTAMVSPKHANFIQADGGGRADDVRALMERIREAVERRHGVVLGTEVRLIGFGVDAQLKVRP